MSESEFAALPATLVVRFVCLRHIRRGNRFQNMIVVTTLLDDKRRAGLGQLTQLYGLRWQAAFVNLRHLKTTLKLEMLTAKSPEMVRKEIWTQLFAYTPHANPNGDGGSRFRTHAVSTLTARRKTAV